MSVRSPHPADGAEAPGDQAPNGGAPGPRPTGAAASSPSSSRACRGISSSISAPPACASSPRSSRHEIPRQARDDDGTLPRRAAADEPDPETCIHALAAAIPPFDEGTAAAARRRQDELTKPTGALGRLETLAVRIAGMTAQERPRLDRRLVVVFAGDHGVAADGVSAYPPEVTGQMVRAFAGGRAAVSVLAREANARLVVVDVGVAAPLPPELPIRHRRVRSGTASFLAGPAMTRDEALTAMLVGVETVEEALADGGLDVLALGEMGIGNTTAAAAVSAAFLGLPAPSVVGRGTGVDDAGLARKRAAVAAGLDRHRPDPADPVGVLAAVGGLELAALAGAILRAAAARVPVLLDGFVVGAAALAAVAFAPAARPFLIAAHRSPEPGHVPVLAALGLEPLLDLGMRLGEGSGAALALPLVAAALAAHDGMATFAEAGVSGRADGAKDGSGGGAA